mmetsp:Transcript_72270/g.202836  ORF Transcript_72270/g.202836 Transcript_72270/m.202836 type:complete len:107 (+) Transcript_72270:112-432(+)
MASQVASTSMQAQSSQERLRGVVLGTSKAVEVIDPSAVSRAGSQCSTAAPPTPDSSSSSTPPLDVRDLATLEEDDDEIMQGMPLWNYSGSSLEEVVSLLGGSASGQ